MTAIPIERFLSNSPLDLGAGAGTLGVPLSNPDTSFRDHLRDQRQVPAKQDVDKPTGSSTQPAASSESDHESTANGAPASAEQPTDDNRPGPASNDSPPADDTSTEENASPTEPDTADADAAEAVDETASLADSADVAVTDTLQQTPANSPAVTAESLAEVPGTAVAPDDALIAHDALTANDASDSPEAAVDDGSAEAEKVTQAKKDSALAAGQSAVELRSDQGNQNPAASEAMAASEGDGRPSAVAGEDVQTTESAKSTNPAELANSTGDESARAKSTARPGAENSPGGKQGGASAEGASLSVTGDDHGDTSEDDESTTDGRNAARKTRVRKNADTAVSSSNRAVSRVEDGASTNSLAGAKSNEAPSSQGEAASAVPRGDTAEPAGAATSPAQASTDGSPAGSAVSESGRTPAGLFSRGADRSESSGRLGDVETTRLVHRVAGAFKAAETRGGEVRLRLSPPELGALRIEVRVDAGIMRARLEAETYVARNALLDNLPALRDRLAEQDIRIEQFDVDLMDRRSGDLPDNSNRRPAPSQRTMPDNPPSSAATEKERAPDPTPAGTWPTEDGGINVIA